MYCARHPNTETFLRCGKCDTPICPSCTVFGPAGARCRDCAALRSSPLYQVPMRLVAVGALVGGLASVFAGFVCAAASEAGLFAQLWAAVLSGWAVGEALLRAIQRKRGRVVETLAWVVSVGAGVVGAALWAVSRAGASSLSEVVDLAVHMPGIPAAVAIMATCAWSRTRL